MNILLRGVLLDIIFIPTKHLPWNSKTCVFVHVLFSLGMSELDDKVSHLKQDMNLYRRQFENKRGDDEV